MTAIYDCITAVFDESADWVDERFIGENGMLQGYVIHKGSCDRYGHFNHADNNGLIRTKLALLALSTISRAVFAGLFRTSYLISGYWIWGQGLPEALLDEKEQRVTCLSKKVAQCSLKHLARATLTSLTYPFNLLLGVGCFFVSIPRPLLARRLFGQIEEAWSLPAYFPSTFISTLNFQAPCMQPTRVKKEYHFREKHLYNIIGNLFQIIYSKAFADDPI